MYWTYVVCVEQLKNPSKDTLGTMGIITGPFQVLEGRFRRLEPGVSIRCRLEVFLREVFPNSIENIL